MQRLDSIILGGPPLDLGPDYLESFDRQVRANPHTMAIVSQETAITYFELNEWSHRLASLYRKQVKKNDLVGVSLPRSPDLVAAAVALARIHAVYVPLGHTTPESRIAEMHVDNGLSFVIDESNIHYLGRNQSIDPKVELGYGVLTSGTTGTPKLVLNERQHLNNLLRWWRSKHLIAPGDSSLLLATPSFDLHLLEMWSALSQGATIVMVRDEERSDPSRLLSLIAHYQTKSVFLPTPLAMHLDKTQWPVGVNLRDIQTGGDRLTRNFSHNIEATWSNYYGPAEGTIIALGTKLLKNANDVPPIGKPISGADAVVVDENGQVVPRGNVGELWISGPLAYGYAGRPDLNASKFVTRIFGELTERRWYKTGDLVRMTQDGTSHFMGRIDSQVKVRGVRIDPIEIENAILSIDGVHDTCVIKECGSSIIEDALVAYYVTTSTNIVTSNLFNQLTLKLPRHLIPDRFVKVSEIPLTRNLKIDREALYMNQNEPAIAPDQQSHDLEAWAWVTWSTEFPVRSQSDTFHSVGGNSYGVLRLVAKAQNERGLIISAGKLYDTPTFSGFISQLRIAKSANSKNSEY